MIPFAPVLAMLPSKPFLYALAIVAALVALWWVVQEHDARVLAQRTVAEQKVAIDTINANHAKAVAALETQAAEAAARADASATIRETIHAAPVTSACANSPAIAAALNGLRQRAQPHSGAATGATKPASVQP